MGGPHRFGGQWTTASGPPSVTCASPQHFCLEMGSKKKKSKDSASAIAATAASRRSVKEQHESDSHRRLLNRVREAFPPLRWKYVAGALVCSILAERLVNYLQVGSEALADATEDLPIIGA